MEVLNRRPEPQGTLNSLQVHAAVLKRHFVGRVTSVAEDGAPDARQVSSVVERQRRPRGQQSSEVRQKRRTHEVMYEQNAAKPTTKKRAAEQSCGGSCCQPLSVVKL